MSNEERKEQIKDHKEYVKKNLYKQDYYTESENGKTYPKSRINVQYITYEWLRLDKDWNYQKYEWDKIKLTVSKLKLNDWEVEVAKKVLTNRKWEAYSVDDKKEIILSVKEFKDLVKDVDLDFKDTDTEKDIDF